MTDAGLRLARFLVVAMIGQGVLACGDDDPVSPTDDFLPIISNTWHDVQNDFHTFSLVSQDDSTASGTFTGEEDHPTEGQSDLDGTFQGRNVSFTIHRLAGDIVYTGSFVHRDTMTLTSSEGAKRIAR